MDDTGQVVHAWGDPDAIIFPRSSCKMLQALPMVEAGVKLSTERLALACASHEGAPEHVAAVRDWITEQGYSDDDFLCGHEAPRDREAKHAMIRAGGSPDQAHNQCSGKHAGFLHFQRHLGAKGAYVDPNGPVQKPYAPRSRRSRKRTAPASASTAVRPRTSPPASAVLPAR